MNVILFVELFMIFFNFLILYLTSKWSFKMINFHANFKNNNRLMFSCGLNFK